MDEREDLQRSRKFARLMDDIVTIPGTSIGVGLDSVLGLVPGVGDVAGSAISGAIIYDAVQSRVPIRVLARMGWNLLLDAALGLVPVAGDLLDVAHRANRKNYRLLERSLEKHKPSNLPTPLYLLAAIGLTVLPLLIGIALGIFVLITILRWVF